MSTNNYFQDVGIHSLDLLSTINSNIATFGSITASSIIKFYTNLNTNVFYNIGMSNNTFIIRNNTDNNGIHYNDDLLRIDNIKTNNINLDTLGFNNSQVIYPNNYTSINSYIFSTSGSVGVNLSSNIFDFNESSYWRSENIFDGTGNLNFSLNLPQFNNIYIEPGSADSNKKGCWISIKLPMSIIITKYHIKAVNYYLQFAPTHFILFGYDYVLKKWRLLNEYSYFAWNTENNDVYIDIDTDKQFLYDQFTLFINQVNGGLYAQVAFLELFAKPIININNSLKISDNNIYNVQTIVANELRLNSDSITTFQGMIDNISSRAIISVQSNISLDWSNLGDNSNTFVFKNVGINTLYPSSALHVKGDIKYNYRAINNYLSLYPHPELLISGQTIPLNRYTSSYIKIGELSFHTNEYFNFDVYTIDIPINSTDFPFTNYSQKINIFGICNPNTNNIYYNNEINNTYLPIDTLTNNKINRITDITYFYINNNKLEFHIKYNSNLNIQSFTSPKHFSNIIYIDFLNTQNTISNKFIFPNTIQYPSIGINPISAIKVSDKIFDESTLYSNVFNFNGRFDAKNILAGDINITSFNSNKIIYTDEFGTIKSTNVSKTQLNRLNDINYSSNYVLITDELGLIKNSIVNTTSLNGLYNISFSSNKIIKTNSSGILTFSDIDDTKLLRFNNISLSSNNVLITDNNGLMTYSKVRNDELLGLSNIRYSSNKVIITNEHGILTNSIVNYKQLERLNDISFSSNKILYTNEIGLLSYSTVTNDMIIGLSNIKYHTNRYVITGPDGYLTTSHVPASNIGNLDNILTLFNFINKIAYTYSNIIIGSNFNSTDSLLFVNGKTSTNNLFVNDQLTINQGIIKWNSNIDTFQYKQLYNWKQFSENILISISKYPPTSLFYNYSIFNVSKNQTIYTLSLNNNDVYGIGYYTIKVDIDDDNIDDRNVYNIFSDDPINNYWKTNNNFDFSSPFGYGNTKYIDQNNNYVNTACGSYIILKLPDKILLTHYNLYYNYDLSSSYRYDNTINTFKLFGYNSYNDYWDLLDNRINIKSWFTNFRPNKFNIDNPYNYKKYDTFALCIIKTNTILDNNYAVINGLELFGNNGYYNNIIYNISSNISTKNNSNIYTKHFSSTTPFLLGNNNIGINNNYPSSLLSIGEDIFTSNIFINSEPILNLNHSCNIDGLNNVGIKVLNLTRPSIYNTNGIRVSHILNTWFNQINDIRTRYDINLSHKYFENETKVLSLLSDGRVGINLTPDNSNYLEPSLSICSNLYIYNTNNPNLNNNKNFISIGVNNITSNYNIILPDSSGNKYDFLRIKDVVNKVPSSGYGLTTPLLEWVTPNNFFNNVTFAKIGYQNLTTCNLNPVKLQVSGHCIIGSNYLNNISQNFINENALIVTGEIYTTNDVTTDSDISYKYDLQKIDNSINKIKSLNGYTFLRNDVASSQQNKRYCGLIAQEVEKIMPEAISIKHDNKLRVMYNNLSALFVEAIKEQQYNIDIMSFKINCIFIFIFSYLLFNLY